MKLRVLLLLVLGACGGSGTDPSRDAGPPRDAAFDAAVDAVVDGATDGAADGATDGAVDGAVDGATDATLDGADADADVRCPNGRIDEGETCDDGNTADGDGCDATCQIEATCGDGEVEGAEGCESTPPNVDAWDGCDTRCRVEAALVMRSLTTSSSGCDLDGDGEADLALSGALGGLAASFASTLEAAVTVESLRALFVFLDLDEPTGANDPSVAVAWLHGVDADGDTSNDFSGTGAFFVTAASLDAAAARTTLASSIAGARWEGETTSELALGVLGLRLARARALGRTTSEAGALHAIEEGRLCGAVPLSQLALSTWVTDLTTDPPCDGGEPPTLRDVMLAGGVARLVVNGTPVVARFDGVAPDLDLDGDGLERFVVVDGAGCQPVVTACLDGDGTRVEGRRCFTDPRFADGYSAAFDFAAIRAQLAGVTGG
ncbi:MAG: hypothetical protein R3B99_02555 [Polyangiales bacterium]|nr:hypothetical protein [Myxococcales bacterium]